LRVKGLGCRVEGEVRGSGCRVKGLRARSMSMASECVWGSEFRVEA